MKLATLFIVSCCVTALPHVAQAQTAIFNFDTNVNGNILGTTPPIGGNFLGNTNNGFVNDTDGTILQADQDTSTTTPPPTKMTLSTTNAIDPGFLSNASFQFQNNGAVPYGTNLNGVILVNVDDLPNDVLTLTFNKPITAVSLQFAIVPNEYDALGNPITGAGGVNDTSALTLLSGGGTLASGGGTLNATSGDFEGSLTATTGGSWTSVELTYSLLGGTDFGFAADTITVTPATSAVPEPGVVAIGAAGLVTIAGLLRRRRR